MTRHVTLLESPDISRLFPIVGDAEGVIADSTVRNRGTIGGSLCQADLAEDLSTVGKVLPERLPRRKSCCAASNRGRTCSWRPDSSRLWPATPWRTNEDPWITSGISPINSPDGFSGARPLADHGAFNATAQPTMYPAGFFHIFTGSYDLQAAHCTVTGVYTNKAPRGVASACSFGLPRRSTWSSGLWTCLRRSWRWTSRNCD